jgi:hypothetical protein
MTKCPSCGHRVLDSVDRLRARRRAKELCAECGKPSGRHFRCAVCREINRLKQIYRRTGETRES